MSEYKCKFCGSNLEYKKGVRTVKCEYCDSWNTIPITEETELQNLFIRADDLRASCQFDKAEQVYEKIIELLPDEPEPYWGYLLCKYGIEYIQDPLARKWLPTCHRASYESILADEDYSKVLKFASAEDAEVYKKQAAEIDRIQKEIVEKSKKEEPYEIFICYKETDERGVRTKDSVLAYKLYERLTEIGYRVFYARVSLENCLGESYEPIIFSALNSAKIMLALGTKKEYFEAVWTKNEWSRFLKLMQINSDKTLIPCYLNISPYDLPQEFSHIQAQDMSKIGFEEDLVRGIKKLVPKNNVEVLLKRGFIALETKDWTVAEGFFEKVLESQPDNANAYLGKLLIDYKERSLEAFLSRAKEIKDLPQNKNFQIAYKYANFELKNKFDGVINVKLSPNKKATSKIIVLVITLAVITALITVSVFAVKRVINKLKDGLDGGFLSIFENEEEVETEKEKDVAFTEAQFNDFASNFSEIFGAVSFDASLAGTKISWLEEKDAISLSQVANSYSLTATIHSQISYKELEAVKDGELHLICDTQRKYLNDLSEYRVILFTKDMYAIIKMIKAEDALWKTDISEIVHNDHCLVEIYEYISEHLLLEFSTSVVNYINDWYKTELSSYWYNSDSYIEGISLCDYLTENIIEFVADNETINTEPRKPSDGKIHVGCDKPVKDLTKNDYIVYIYNGMAYLPIYVTVIDNKASNVRVEQNVWTY